MHMYEDIKNMLCDELEEVTRKGELTAGSLDIIDKITHAIKSIDTIVAMERYDDDNHTRRYTRGDGESMIRGDGRRSYAPRRRDAMGRYTTRYTRDDAKADMVADLHEIMNDTTDENLKHEVKKFIEKVENM